MRNEKVIPKTEKIQINQRKSLRKEKRLKRKIKSENIKNIPEDNFDTKIN